MSPTEAEANKARAIADRVIRHAVADPHFREELKTNPTAVLEKAGMPEGAIEDVARELEIDGVPMRIPCVRTCWWSCLITCLHTSK
jgi:hypothetical protein